MGKALLILILLALPAYGDAVKMGNAIIATTPALLGPPDDIEWIANVPYTRSLTIRGNPSDDYLRGWCDGFRQNDEARYNEKMHITFSVQTPRGEFKCPN